MHIFIIGANGFIGNALTRRILTQTSWLVTGIDLRNENLGDMLDRENFRFRLGDLVHESAWIEEQIQRCDVVVPLAAIATPQVYIDDPLRVFELDFLENLKIVKLAAKHGKRIIQPSTSEVYGMATDAEFDENSTNFIVGPINKHRWIYSSAKQLLDRVLHAYGVQKGLRYTIFRPFNWVGPRLDRIDASGVTKSRVITQFISNILHDRAIAIVNQGTQQRCFLYIEDGIDALMSILIDKNKNVDHKIFNIGNPMNEISIIDLAHLLIYIYKQTTRANRKPFTAGITMLPGERYYGAGYQDISHRKPSIRQAEEHLHWRPTHDLTATLRRTMDWFLEQE